MPGVSEMTRDELDALGITTLGDESVRNLTRLYESHEQLRAALARREQEVGRLREALEFGERWATGARGLLGIAVRQPPSAGWLADEFIRKARAALTEGADQ